MNLFQTIPSHFVTRISLSLAAAASFLALPACSAPVEEDSAYAVYNASSAVARLRFLGDGRITRDGELRESGSVALEYAADRVKECSAAGQGAQSWTTTVHASFDGKDPITQWVSGAGPNGEKEPPLLEIPSGTRSAVLWFETKTPSGCAEVDANNGSNYLFEILPREQ